MRIVIVPLQPSIFDIFATQKFPTSTRATEQLHRFVDGLGLPVGGHLRDTQIYMQLAAQGLTLWDVASLRCQWSKQPPSG